MVSSRPGVPSPLALTHEHKRRNDAPDKDPLGHFKLDGHCAIVSALAVDGVGPIVGGQHGDGRKDVEAVDGERFGEQEVDKDVAARRVVCWVRACDHELDKLDMLTVIE